MTLKERIQTDLKDAMRAGAAERRDVLRLLRSAIKQVEVDEQRELDDEGVQAVLMKEAKQRRESIADAKEAGRDDLIAQERAELKIIETYLPEMMTREEIRVEATKVCDEVGATGMKDMGRVMGTLMPRLKSQAEGSVVSEVVRELLQERQSS